MTKYEQRFFFVTAIVAFLITFGVVILQMYETFTTPVFEVVEEADTESEPEPEESPLPDDETEAEEQNVHIVVTDVPMVQTPVFESEPKIEAERELENWLVPGIALDCDNQRLLKQACDEMGVDFHLALAVIWTETRYQNINGDGGNSIGYMQVQPRWHYNRMERLGVTDLTDPLSNFRVGCSYLGEMVEKYTDIHKALMAYNMGESGARKLWNAGITTSNYSCSVIEYMEEVT